MICMRHTGWRSVVKYAIKLLNCCFYNKSIGSIADQISKCKILSPNKFFFNRDLVPHTALHHSYSIIHADAKITM
jgi:hypothetical protein